MQAVHLHLKDYESRLEGVLGQLQVAVSGEEMGEALANQGFILQSAITTLVEAAADALKESPIPDSDDLLTAYFINFDWVEQAKAYLLLWRDSLFELVKGMVGVADSLYKPEEIPNLVREINTVLQASAADLRDKVTHGLAALQKDPNLRNGLNVHKGRVTNAAVA